MIIHERPGIPWIKDLFEIGDRNYLNISDYFSRYPVAKELPTTTVDSVIRATTEIVSILDVPCEVVSDNGPHFLHRYDDFFFTVEYQAQHVKSTVSPIKWLYRKTDSLHQTNHKEMPQIKRICQQSDTQRPSGTTRHCVTQSSRTDVSMTNDNTSSMSCSDGT